MLLDYPNETSLTKRLLTEDQKYTVGRWQLVVGTMVLQFTVLQ